MNKAYVKESKAEAKDPSLLQSVRGLACCRPFVQATWPVN